MKTSGSVKEARHKRTNAVRLHLDEGPRVLRFIETEGRMLVARAERKRRTECSCLMGTEFQFLKMKNVLEMDGSNGCTTI